MPRSPDPRPERALLLLIFAAACSDAGPTTVDAAALPTAAATPAAQLALDDGAVRPIASLPGYSPENLALDRLGRIWVGRRYRDPASGVFLRNEIVRIDRDGDLDVIADLGPAASGGAGVLGIAIDRSDDVYAAFASGDPATRGVYRLSRDGSTVQRLSGSEDIPFPNGLTFDVFENLYATDSLAGAVWRCPRGGTFDLWIQDPLLAPTPVPGFPPLPGANGIAYQVRGGIFVANSSRGTIVSIPIRRRGGAGAPAILASGVLGIDGLAAPLVGPLYFVNAGANLLGIPAVNRVDPRTGEVTGVTSDLVLFDDPTGIAMGGGRSGPATVLIANADIFPPTGAGPGIVQVGVR